MVTIKEIAERAKVSRTTVSRVINNSGYVSEDAKKRVLKVIEDTGYVPNQYAKSLRTKSTKVIGVILPKISTETSSRLVKGLDEILAKEGYQILLTITNLDPNKEIEYLKLLKSRNVDGIILSATNINEVLIEEIHQGEVPFVTVGQHIAGLANVLFDDYRASRDMVSLFVEKGHKKIAFIGVDEQDHSVGYLRKQGYLKGLEEYGLTAEDKWIQKGKFDVESGYESMKSIMEDAKQKPSAVLAVTDRLAIGAIRYLNDIGLSVPNDIAVAGMGGSELSKYISPSLTTIDFSIEDAGREAAKLLLKQIDGSSCKDVIRLIDHRLLNHFSI
ncbi:transcriptional regulator, LacI family [Psychrobacillus sp. OK028]|uniref:LacI family DNA-binding transcriptional regulator n=1 Tax=Psychrobacillus sp. OK028 TaxID=1884359 RepID=UPI00087EECCE|nr:LacI family DNA-binding transcriptional regulator [Psychrobacillus sp. OK028]SDN86678.1 transcriptional regulator, LacI family [Psychrobacillus sp. OK028]